MDRSGRAASLVMAGYTTRLRGILKNDWGKAMSINRYAADVFFELRRIARIFSLESHKVEGRHQVTGPQLIVLRQIWLGDTAIPSLLAKRVYLSQATVTGILDRLEAGGLIMRERKFSDRRQVSIHLTDKGRALAESLSPPLLERLSSGFEALPSDTQVSLAETMKRLADMLEDRPAETLEKRQEK